MPKVKLTIFPDPIDVPEDEIPVLRAQGLLVEDSDAPAATVKSSPRKDEQS